MNESPQRAPPGFGPVFLEQVRAVGLGLRREATALAAVFAGLGLILLLDAIGEGDPLDLDPSDMLLVAALGLVLPFAVWKGERVFGGAYLWTLPIDRRRLSLAKIAAGCDWLLAAGGARFFWMLGMTLLSGGSVGADEIRYLASGVTGERSDPAALTPQRWTTPWWEWVVPFVAGVVAYLFGSAFRLGLKHPLRWAACLGLGLFAFLVLSEEFLDTSWIERVIQFAIIGPYGADWVLTGGTEVLAFDIRGADGASRVVWRGLPTVERWAGATTVWALLGGFGLFAALFRHRES